MLDNAYPSTNRSLDPSPAPLVPQSLERVAQSKALGPAGLHQESRLPAVLPSRGCRQRCGFSSRRGRSRCRMCPFCRATRPIQSTVTISAATIRSKTCRSTHLQQIADLQRRRKRPAGVPRWPASAAGHERCDVMSSTARRVATAAGIRSSVSSRHGVHEGDFLNHHLLCI